MLTHRFWQVSAGMVLASSLCTALVHGQTAAAQQQPSSLGDAARKVRADNKGRQPAKVFTNENIGDVKGTVSVVGTEPPAPPAAAAAGATPSGTPAPGTPAGSTPAPGAAATADAAAAPKAEVKGEEYWRGQFVAARKKLADDSKELDILQREYNLKEQQFYSNPNVAMREQYGRTDLNKTRDEINTKKTDVEKDQQAITTLEDSLRKAGGNPGWARTQ